MRDVFLLCNAAAVLLSGRLGLGVARPRAVRCRQRAFANANEPRARKQAEPAARAEASLDSVCSQAHIRVAEKGDSIANFKQLMRDIEAEAQAEGPAAVAELAAFDTRFALASELMQLRKQMGVTQKELASVSGVNQAEISRIERGEINPTVLTLARLLRPLGARLSIARTSADENLAA